MKEPTHSKELQRPKLTRDRILDVALGLAKSEGLGALSMRRVAGLLEVEAMSLYKYVESKDDLIDGVIEQIVSQIALPSALTPWRQAIRERARSEFQILREHAWIIHLLESRSGTGLIRLQHQNHMLGILRDSGFSIELAFQTMIMITGQVYGFVVFATAWNPQGKERANTVRKAKQQITPASHPYILEAISFAQARPQSQSLQHDTEFELGLELLLDGIEKRFSEQRQSGRQ